ncbi:CDC27 family protein [Sulfurimonas sp.]
MFKRVSKIVFFSLLCANLVAKNSDDMVDHIALATLMIYDANYKKAHEELAVVKHNSPKFDAAKYYRVLGVLYAKEGDTQKAINAYKKAINATKIKKITAPKQTQKEHYLFSIASNPNNSSKRAKFDPEATRKKKLEELYIYLAGEYYKLKDYKNTVLALENAGERGKSRPALYTLRAECYYKIKKYNNAIEALNKGIAKFPQSAILLKQKFYYYADLHLYQASIDTAKIYMQKVGVSPKEYITLAQILLGANELNSAIELLEDAKLQFPKSAKIDFLLAHLYLKKEMLFVSANLFEQSTYYEKKYIKDAVEMNRRAGNIHHALYLNMQNTNKVEKLKQKIAIYLEAEEFRKIIGLKKALKRYKMLDDDNLRYALAYAYYMAGDYKHAQSEMKFISNSELFNKATVIRKNIEKCTNNPMECL